MYIYTPYIKLLLILIAIVVTYLYFRDMVRRKPGDNKPKLN
jgi:hypothetical protein